MEKIKNKLCRGCFRELLINAFGACVKSGKTYYNSRCKTCCKNNIHRQSQSELDMQSGYKICIKCKLKKDISHFNFDSKHNIYRTKCKECKHSEYTPIPYQYEIDIKNGYKICTKCKAKKDLSRFTRPASLNGSYYPHCKDCRREYVLDRLHSNVQFRLKQTLSKRIWHSLKNKNIQKSKRTMELIGCDIPFLIKYLELQFKPGMTWDNYGKWHVDHIRPCISFDLQDTVQQKKCFHYTNLQPLWAYDNLSKGDKLI